MTVYIDRPMWKKGTSAGWSHLVADSGDELYKFAVRMGISSYFHGRPYTHVDVSPRARRRVMEAGAVQVPNKELLQIAMRMEGTKR